MKDLNCFVTGASSGIGREIAIGLSKYAKHIYICARDIGKLEIVCDIITKNKCECTIVPLDLSDKNGIENLANQLYKKDRPLDILVLSAGIISQLSPVTSIDLEKLNDILKLNFLSNFRLIKCFHPLLMHSKNANIALISSIKESAKEHYWGIYQPIMTTLNELILTYALENKNTNIKVNIFCPKAVNTKFRETIVPGEDKTRISEASYVAKQVIDYILKTKNSGELINIT